MRAQVTATPDELGTVTPYGQLILSRLAVKRAFAFVHSAQKRTVFAELESPSLGAIAVRH